MITADVRQEHHRREPGCPKRMRFGPCGGAQPGGGCEVPGVRCPFTAAAGAVLWDQPPHTADPPPALPAVVADLRPDPTLEWEVAAAADALGAAGAGVLIGEHVDDPTPHQPAAVAEVVARHEVPTIATLTCRGRTVIELAEQLERLAELDLSAVHCVTGDHPAARLGLDDEPLFSMDSFELADLARRHDIPVSVAESPAAPPTQWRPIRLASKQAAGARLAVLNHGGGPDAMVRFADACRRAGVTMPLVAPVPVITDRHSADALRRFPGLHLPAGLLDEILDADDPATEGRATAVRLGRCLLESGRFAAVNLSGSASSAGVVDRARIMASVAEEITSP